MGPSQISDTPFHKVMSSYFSNIHISDTQISHIIHSSSYIYIYTAVSCKRYPPSLPYIIIVQTCGKRWDLPKFVNVLSVNLGFSQSLMLATFVHTKKCIISYIEMAGIFPNHDPHNYWVKYQNPDSKQLRSFWEQHSAETIGTHHI